MDAEGESEIVTATVDPASSDDDLNDVTINLKRSQIVFSEPKYCEHCFRILPLLTTWTHTIKFVKVRSHPESKNSKVTM